MPFSFLEILAALITIFIGLVWLLDFANRYRRRKNWKFSEEDKESEK